MNFSRYRVLIIGSAISLVLLGVGIFFLISAQGKLSDLENEISGLETRKSRLAKAEVFPSSENFNQLKKNRELLSERIAVFRKTIEESQVQPVAMDPAGFGDFLTAGVAQLREKAKASKSGGEEGVVLRDTGFQMDDYQAGVPPRPADVARLMIQVQTVFHIAHVLCDAGISELIEIQREKFETAAGLEDPLAMLRGGEADEPESSARRGSRRSKKNLKQKEEVKDPVEERVKEMFGTEKFTVRFRAYESKLVNVLNVLATDKNQIVISDLQISNGNRDLWPRYQSPSANIEALGGGESTSRDKRKREGRNRMMEMFGGADARKTAADDDFKENKSVPMVGLTAERQKETGGELLEVVLDLSVYRLKAEESSDGKGEG